jgi:hypothetical protein
VVPADGEEIVTKASCFLRKIALGAGLAFAGGALAGCGTSGMTDAMAVVAQPRLPAPGSATFAQNRSEQGSQQTGVATNLSATAPRATTPNPRNPGEFPNLNNRPQAAAEQLTADDTRALLSDLRSSQNRINAANVQAARTMPDVGALRRVGSAHGDQALEAIAAENAAAQ